MSRSAIWIDPTFLDRTEFDTELAAGAPSRLREVLDGLGRRSRRLRELLRDALRSRRLRELLRDALVRTTSRDGVARSRATRESRGGSSVEVAS